MHHRRERRCVLLGFDKNEPEDLVSIQVQSVDRDNNVSGWSAPSVPDFSIHGSYPKEALDEAVTKGRSWIPYAAEEEVTVVPYERGIIYSSVHKDYTATGITGGIMFRANGNHDSQVQSNLFVSEISEILSPRFVEFKIVNKDGTVRSRETVEVAQGTNYTALGKTSSEYMMIVTADFYDGDKHIARYVIERINPHFVG